MSQYPVPSMAWTGPTEPSEHKQFYSPLKNIRQLLVLVENNCALDDDNDTVRRDGWLALAWVNSCMVVIRAICALIYRKAYFNCHFKD